VSYENATCGARRFLPRSASPRRRTLTRATRAVTMQASSLLCNKSASSFSSPAGAVSAGKAVCGCLNNGESGLELVHDVKIRNAGFTMEDASDFAMIAAKFYCPQQLSKS